MTTTENAPATITTTKSWLPTRKWFAAQIAAVATLLVAWLNADGWNKTLAVALVGLVAQALITYIVPNQETPGGVPVKQVTSA